MSPQAGSAKKADSRRHYVLGISGASGGVYACRLIEALLADPGIELHLVITAAGLRVMKDELGGAGNRRKRKASASARGPNSSAKRFDPAAYVELSAEQAQRLHHHPIADIGAGPAGGTFQTEGMVVVPCSMNTLAGIAHGLEDNLLLRSAAVTLKEGRTLIVVPRETPLNLIQLRNMVAVTEAGGVVLPANPGFYNRPEKIEDLVRFVVQKIMDRLGVEFSEAVRWQGTPR